MIALSFACFLGTLAAQQNDPGAKWFGLNNLYYQNQSTSQVDTFFTSNNQLLVVTDEDSKNAISFGFHYRLMGDNQSYQQFELVSFDREVIEEGLLSEIIGQQISEPTRGFRQVNWNIRVGYRRGKLITLHDWITADISLGAYPTFQRTFRSPLASADFPRRDLRAGIGLDARLGLNFQVHPNLNIGYSFVPVAVDWAWQQSRVENPILVEEQRTGTSFEMQTEAFADIFDFRNISIRYVIPAN